MLIIEQVRGYEVFAEHFDLFKEQKVLTENWNIGPGNNFYAISDENSKELQPYLHKT